MKPILYWITLLLLPLVSFAQNASDSILTAASLDQVVQYALVHQPAVQQAQLDEEITEKGIKGKLADWYPQVNFTYNYQHFLDLQQTVFNGTVIPIGVKNSSFFQFTANQTIFNRDILLASTTASTVRLQAEQNINRSKIDVVVNVTKAFYDVLATMQQISVNEESIIRLKRSLKDAYSRYNSGLADKTDYKRATILLGNAEASLKSNQEVLKYKQEFLKTLMGYPAEQDLPLVYDTLQMENEIFIDTLQTISYANNIEYGILNTQLELQEANVKYSNHAFLPTVGAFVNYNINYQNNNFRELFDKRFPYSYAGVSVSLPLFQGGKRMKKIQEQKLTRERLEVSVTNLESNLNTEYTRALASYKSNLVSYYTQKENVVLAEEVYTVIELQYRNGVRTYLDVTVAESDLRTTRINYFNALYAVLASKVDVQRVLGQIDYTN
mgnify:CR=1 FL=1